ncbi:MAG: Methyltransferase type 11, partial [Verrucomicrobiaceae bacterium]|nr:Methyltransferase type 11 [Verrucomicrobiaceae bacterium]
MKSDSIKPWELKEAYEQGRNIMQMVRDNAHSQVNDERTIELSYDLQSGSYIRYVESAEGHEQRRAFTRQMADFFEDLGPIGSLMEAGVGESVTLWHLLDQLPHLPSHVHGFDLCWSRVACGEKWMSRQQPRFEATLTAASLLEVPYEDNSFDVVYTAHTIEPNHGREAAILAELYRVTNKYLVLLEPAYELGSNAARARMEQHGYCRGLPATARALGFEVLRHELFA